MNGPKRGRGCRGSLSAAACAAAQFLRHSDLKKVNGACTRKGPPIRRASLRDAQVLEGQYPLPDQDPRKSQNRDEPARTGLQYEADDQHLRRQTADGRHRRLSTLTCRCASSPHTRNNGRYWQSRNRVSARPRSVFAFRQGFDLVIGSPSKDWEAPGTELWGRDLEGLDWAANRLSALGRIQQKAPFGCMF